MQRPGEEGGGEPAHSERDQRPRGVSEGGEDGGDDPSQERRRRRLERGHIERNKLGVPEGSAPRADAA